jgi:predicted permease
MGSFLQDLRYGVRTLIKDRAFLFTAVLALALGIGSTTAIFSVIDNVLLEPFPYTDGQRLMAIMIHDKSSSDEFGRQFFQAGEFLDYQEQNHVFDRSIGLESLGVLMTGTGAPESFRGAGVTGNTFEFMGIPPLLGRALTPEDAKPGAPPTFVLSYKAWRKKFAMDRSILGKTYTLNGQPTTLIGIMPKRFAWWGADLWLPTTISRGETGPNARFFFLLGHLKPGLTAKAATPDLDIIARRLAKVYPNNYPKQFEVRVQALVDNVVGKFRNTLYTLLAAVGLLLLIACANVANLLLAKATARDKEFAVRATLGAGRWRLVRQLMAESILVALAGAVAGCAFAWLELKGLIALLPQFTFPDEADIRMNTPVLLATLGAALLTALLFGLAPALGAARRDLNEALKTTGRGNSGFRRGRLRNALIVSEVALSLVLLAGAGLLMRSFFVQRSVDLDSARREC